MTAARPPAPGAPIAPTRRRPSLLRRPATWRLLGIWAAIFGLATGAYEAILAFVIPELPGSPWQATFRFVHALIWALAVALAIAIAERWPVQAATRQWGRVLAQVGVGLVIGPVWGVIAYAFSGVFMPWRREVGVWGIIATDAKGALFAYGTAAIVAHVVLRAREQRERAVALVEAKTRLAEARVRIVTLGMQSEGVLAALDAIVDLVPRNPKAANDALVLLADVLGQFVELTRAGSASLGEELALASAQARLLATQGMRVDVQWSAPPEALTREVPHLAVWPVLEQAIHRASRGDAAIVRVQADAQRPGELTIIVAEEVTAPDQTSLPDDAASPDGLENLDDPGADVRLTRRVSRTSMETVIFVRTARAQPEPSVEPRGTVTVEATAPTPHRPAHA